MNGDPRPTPPTLSGNAITPPDSQRNIVIEECARVAETLHAKQGFYPLYAEEIAAAIRALKDKV